MSKKRKTKAKKIAASVRRSEGFVIDQKLFSGNNKDQKVSKRYKLNTNQFKADLTKTLVLTMLVLALELALWQYLN